MKKKLICPSCDNIFLYHAGEEIRCDICGFTPKYESDFIKLQDSRKIYRKERAEHEVEIREKRRRQEKDIEKHSKDGGCIYFILDRVQNAVKIGYTKNLGGRLGGLQSGNPGELRIILTVQGDVRQEILLHNKFRKDQIQGEWFRYSKGIKNFIARHSSITPREKLKEVKG